MKSIIQIILMTSLGIGLSSVNVSADSLTQYNFSNSYPVIHTISENVLV